MMMTVFVVGMFYGLFSFLTLRFSHHKDTMFRISSLARAVAIPREAWDPTHHSPTWIDSYAEAVPARRDWPVRKWLVGLMPKTQKEYLGYSIRNSAYEYNAAMRACSTFPEMIPYYKEMFVRGVRMDVDTMYVVLSRAARFEGVTAQQVFELYDEMQQQGARPDIAVAEVLHTVWDLTPPIPDDAEHENFRETRRQQLCTIYNELCGVEVHRLGGKKLFPLMQQTFQKFRANLRTLKMTISLENYAAYVSYLEKVQSQNDAEISAETGALQAVHALGSVQGAVLALRDDIWDIYGEGLEVTNVENKLSKYFKTLPEVFERARRGPLVGSLEDGVAAVYLAALNRVLMLKGSGSAEDTPVAIWVINSLFGHARVDLKGSSPELNALFMDVGKYFGRSSFARQNLRLSWGRHDMRLVSRYICSLDPWEQLGFHYESDANNKGRFKNRKGASANKLEAEGETPPPLDVKTGREMFNRYAEVRGFGLSVISSARKGNDGRRASEIMNGKEEFPASLLWFLRKAVDGLAPETAKMTKDVAKEALHILVDIAQVTKQVLGDKLDGEYIDHYMNMLNVLYLRSPEDKDIQKEILKVRVELLDHLKQDPALMMVWAEEV